MFGWFNHLKLGTRIVAVAAPILVGVLAVNYTTFVRGYRASAIEAMVEKAKAFSAVADESKNHASLLHGTDTFNTEALVAELTRDLAAGKPLESTRYFKTIPVVAGWTAAQEAAAREKIDFRISSFDARNKSREPKPGSFEETLLRQLTEQAAANRGETVHGIDPATGNLHFLRAIRLSSNCLGCHGEAGSKWDPDKDGKDATGARMEGWKAGDMHGGYHVVMPLAPVNAQVNAFVREGLLWSLPLVLLGGGVFVYLLWNILCRPVRLLTERTREFAGGHLTRPIPTELQGRADEVGDLARAMQSMSDSLSGLIREVSLGAGTLGSASGELTRISTQTTTNLDSISERSATVAAAAEQSSANSGSVAASMEQTTANLSSVASATEQMSATVGEIAANSERARVIAEQANSQAQTVSVLMQQLGDAAREIGKVTETITDISSQTNLLALNATIEAARAGAAGKGFAVVANEIKELARQTAGATEDIKAKIAGVQTSAGGAIADIEKISGIIKDVGHIVASIAAAIEEQAAVTKDVATNIAQASSGVKDANERVAQTATVSHSIAQDIATLNRSMQGIRDGGNLVHSSAVRLSTLAGQLQATLGKFESAQASPASVSHASPAAPARDSKAEAPKPANGQAAPSPSKPAAKPAGNGRGRVIVNAPPQSGSQAACSTPGNGDEAFMPWKNEYSVGVVSMDAHHKKLVGLINRLHDALKAGEAEVTTKSVLKELVAYTQYHFKAEEELLTRNKYEGLEEHKKIHRAFLGTVSDALQRWEGGDKSVPQDLLKLLEQWLVKHITSVDKEYGICFARLAAGAKDPTCPKHRLAGRSTTPRSTPKTIAHTR